jgi:hypothetical protein
LCDYLCVGRSSSSCRRSMERNIHYVY